MYISHISIYILSIHKIHEATVSINHVRHVERENFFGRRQWFPRRKEHRRRGTARKIANWYTENINKTAVRIPMIYCKVWLNSFDSVYPLAARTTLTLCEPPMFSLFFSFISLLFFPHSLVHPFRRCKVTRCKTGNSERYKRFLLQPVTLPCHTVAVPNLHFAAYCFVLFYLIRGNGKRYASSKGMILQSNCFCIFFFVSIR